VEVQLKTPVTHKEKGKHMFNLKWDREPLRNGGIPTSPAETKRMLRWAEQQGAGRIEEGSKAKPYYLAQALAGAVPPPKPDTTVLDPAGCTVLAKSKRPEGQPVPRVRSAHTRLMKLLSQCGIYSKKSLARARELCTQWGLADWQRLPNGAKAAILIGAMVHARSVQA